MFFSRYEDWDDARKKRQEANFLLCGIRFSQGITQETYKKAAQLLLSAGEHYMKLLNIPSCYEVKNGVRYDAVMCYLDAARCMERVDGMEKDTQLAYIRAINCRKSNVGIKTLLSYAASLTDKRNFKYAIEIYQLLYKQSWEDDKRSLYLCEIANLYIALRNFKKAIAAFTRLEHLESKNYNYAKKTFVNDERRIIFLRYGLCRIQCERPDDAKRNIKRSYAHVGNQSQYNETMPPLFHILRAIRKKKYKDIAIVQLPENDALSKFILSNIMLRYKADANKKQ